MNKVFMMVGIPGSGKSTYAREVLTKKYENAIYISSDVIRSKYVGIDEKDVFPKAYELVANALKDGKDVIYDATNVTPEVRQRFKDNVNKYNVEYELYAYCILIEKNKAFDRIVQRNLVPEEHKMPPEVTLNYYDKLTLPTKQEGFKEIFIINS